MSDDEKQIVAEAQLITDKLAAENQAELVLAFYLRLRFGKKMPEPVAHDLTIRQFYPPTLWVETDDD